MPPTEPVPTIRPGILTPLEAVALTVVAAWFAAVVALIIATR